MQKSPYEDIKNTFSPQWIERIWARDSTLWADQEAHHFLGWLDLPDSPTLKEWDQQAARFMHASQASSYDDAPIQNVLLIGIGGSALGARALTHLNEAYRRPIQSLPTLTILDTLDHETVYNTMQRCTPAQTKIIVASKSGSTMEIMALYRCFRAWMENSNAVNIEKQFIAITDPDSPLEKLAVAERFFTTISGKSSIGGRFSLFSPFGLFPAACVGMDIEAIVESAKYHQRSCQSLNIHDNQGVQWGMQLAAWQAAGKSLLQLVYDETTRPFAEWLQQLIAESTGKKDHALLPFLSSAPSAIEHADGLATIYLSRTDRPSSDSFCTHDWPPSCYSFCFSMAVYGLIRNFNPFDQPDVESTKQVMRQTLQHQDTSLSPPALLSSSALSNLTLKTTDALCAFIRSHKPFRFMVFFDYLPASLRQSIHLVKICEDWSRQLDCPVFSVEGPAFLHSTGQLFKGAVFAEQGCYIVLTASESEKPNHHTHISIPDFSLDMASMRKLQALADCQVMHERDRQIAILDLPELLSTCQKL